MRIGALHHLAVQLQDQPQHAVRGGMLRAEIDRVVVDLDRGQGFFGDDGLAHATPSCTVSSGQNAASMICSYVQGQARGNVVLSNPVSLAAVRIAFR